LEPSQETILKFFYILIEARSFMVNMQQKLDIQHRYESFSHT